MLPDQGNAHMSRTAVLGRIVEGFPGDPVYDDLQVFRRIHPINPQGAVGFDGARVLKIVADERRAEAIPRRSRTEGCRLG